MNRFHPFPAAVRVVTRVPGPPREFHVAKSARDVYGFEEGGFSVQGHLLFADIRAARDFAMRMNTVRRAALHPERTVRAGDVYAMGLIDEIFHYVINLYLEQYGRGVVDQLETTLSRELGEDRLSRLLLTFSSRFPTAACYRDAESPQESLDRNVDGVTGRHVALEELIVMWIGNRNPAYTPLIELFDEKIIAVDTGYERAMHIIGDFFRDLPTFGPDDQTLLNMLRSPALAHPDDLQAQLEYIRSRWASLIGAFLERLLRSLDVLSEEHRARFFGPGESHVPVYDDGEADYARFSPDREWMPRAVIIAKSTLVWLDQLSKHYGREIRTLDAVPDEELDLLAGRGFTGLWLIGLWQRSRASKRIKHLCGNPDAEASAYALHDYEIADELGGWEALDTLRRRLWQRGIRIASDMVPNHTGIDSRWVYERPDWFIGVADSPFPGYSFNGENLSSNPGVGIYLEDHYYDRTDAAVVFKRVDLKTGETRHIYHGNDGTSMPWNDTAQLDYLNAEAREAVIQTILHVARNFPIIRFDAAMTLAKKHIQRLWYPAPGHGGDIPSRSEHGLPASAFDEAIPIEFWREVVDRVASEVPDTLLLAEAFWMMESFFVRNLGMHRVYNSAFMNMLKNEENEKYRQTIKNTLEYDPEVLKRFVNFMSNPDEETSIAQFGTGDKYFGVATLMVTMPGLPMFGHGQIEGFAEKYGMEYRKAYWDETPDTELVARHEREIFSLMHRRHLFADATHFRLFDVYDADGNIHPHVFAYTNRHYKEYSLVSYNNNWERAAGWIHTSTSFAADDDHAQKGRRLKTEQLGPALGLTDSWHHFAIFQEQRCGLWFIRNSGEIHERGLYMHLEGYQSQVFLNIYEVEDNQFSHYARLADHLGGAGTTDINYSLKLLLLQPLHDAFGVLANTGVLRTLCEALRDERVPVNWKEISEEYRGFLGIASQFCDHTTRIDEAVAFFRQSGEALMRLPQLAHHTRENIIGRLIAAHIAAEREDASVFLALLMLLPLDLFVNGDERVSPHAVGFQAVDQAAEWELVTILHRVLTQLQPDRALPHYWEPLLRTTLAHHNWWHYTADTPPREAALAAMELLLADSNVEDFLQIHVHNGVTWFNQEVFELFVDWLMVVGAWHELAVAMRAGASMDWTRVETVTETMAQVYDIWREAERGSEFRVDRLMAALESRGADGASKGADRKTAPRRRRKGTRTSDA